MEGVACVLTAADLGGLDAVVDFYALDNADGSKAAAPKRPLLATGRVRFVGEPVALVVAATAGQARDAAEAVALDYEELPVHMAVAPGGPAIHAEAPSNVCFDWEAGDRTATDAAFGRAVRTVRARIEDNRVMAASLEPRGAYAEWGGDGRVHLCFNGQGVWGMKRELARVLGIEAERVRVTNPDVGGGFGMKAPAYPEYFLIAEASRRVGAPVRWMADRTEAMLADNGGRDLVSEAEMAFDEGGPADRLPGRFGLQPRGLRLRVRAGGADGVLRQGADRGLRRGGGAHALPGGVHQHLPGGRLSRCRAARGDLRDRADDGSRGRGSWGWTPGSCADATS